MRLKLQDFGITTDISKQALAMIGIVILAVLALTVSGCTVKQPPVSNETKPQPQPDLAYLQAEAAKLKGLEPKPDTYYQIACKEGLSGIADSLHIGGSRIWEIITTSTNYPCPPSTVAMVKIRKAQEVEQAAGATRRYVYDFLHRAIGERYVLAPVRVSRLTLILPTTDGVTHGKSLIDVDDDGFLDAILEFTGAPFGEFASDNFLQADLGELRVPLFAEQQFYYCIKRQEFESPKRIAHFSDPCCLLR